MDNNKVNDIEVDEIIPLKGMGKIIASRMMESLIKSPQASGCARIDMSGLESLKKKYAVQGHKVTYTEMVIKIAAQALEENPTLNASLQDGKITVYKSKNIGFAVSTPDDSLIVPVIKNVQAKSLLEVSAEVKEMVNKMRNGTLSMKDCSGGTFTVSSLGMFNMDMATPIINMPEAAIIAVGCTKKEPVVDENDLIVIKPMTTISITIDHAAVNGVPAARFLMSMEKIMKNPEEYIN